ncbi:MAG TPA: amino acid permease [Bryobacteraceae bacterium]|nr:amino acid permease [Bryobacteraceae bacterium]
MRHRAELPRKLGLADCIAIVVGTIIGSAIFIVPGAIARSLPSAPLMLAVWLTAGLLSLFGALAFAELGAMLPDTGGQYVYLRESFGPLWAFLCGWSFFLIIRSGGIATVAVGFSIYLAALFPIPPALVPYTAPALILLLTWVNYRGVEGGALVQKIFTLLKVIGLAVLIAGAFLHPQTQPVSWSVSAAEFSWARFGVAMIAGLWAYNGWMAIGFVAGEVKNPGRNVPLSLGIGMAVVLAVYLLTNLGYLRILPISEIAATDKVAAVLASRTMGAMGVMLVSATIVLSTIGTDNGNILTASRIYFAQARDGLFFRSIGKVHPRFQTPYVSILVQGAWAALLSLSGSYQKLFSFAMFAAWIFYGLCVVAVIVLRRKAPALPRPYWMWGYPVTPVLFALMTVWFIVNTLVEEPVPSLCGLLLIASGIPVYVIWSKRTAPVQEAFAPIVD